MKQPFNLEQGFIPPHDEEVEKIVLGTIILEPNSINDVMDIITTNVFYKPAHQRLFSVIFKMFETDKSLDMISIVEGCRQKGYLEEVGGPYYITTLMSRIVSSVNIQEHCKLLVEKSIKRDMIETASKILSKAYDECEDVFDLVNFANESVAKIQEGTVINSNIKHVGEFTDELEEDLNKRYVATQNGNGQLQGIETGLIDLNMLTNGWQNSDLTILAGRPAMGKTALLLHLAKSASRVGKKVCIFSLEMASKQLVQRMIIGVSGIDPENYKNGNLTSSDWLAFNKAKKQVNDMNIFIDDKSNVSPQYIKNVVLSKKKRGECDMILIDYLQLMKMSSTNKTYNKNNEVADVCVLIKSLAKQANIPIVLLSQLSRAVESRTKKIPMLSDLRDSGGIEETADQVFFIYRPAYYDTPTFEDGKNAHNAAQIIIAKHRNGQCGEVKFTHNDSLTAITNFTESTEVSSMPKSCDQF